jgi:hypothetical protein
MTRPLLSQKIVLPAPVAPHDTLAAHLCHGFMHHFSGSSGSEAQRIQGAIVSLARQMAQTPASVAQKLVENGLCAGPECFPEEFLTLLEKRTAQPCWAVTGASAPERALVDSWRKNAPAGQAHQVSGYKQGLKI